MSKIHWITIIAAIVSITTGCNNKETTNPPAPAEAPGAVQAPAQAPNDAAQAPTADTPAETAPAPEKQDEQPAAADAAGDKETVICGKVTLDAADAAKWDCVPEIGFWCIDPAGCPAKGKTETVGTRLSSDNADPSDNTNAPLQDAEPKICSQNDGCKCGSQLCPEGFECQDDVCVFQHNEDNEDGTIDYTKVF